MSSPAKIILALTFIVTLSGCVIRVNAQGNGGNVDKVMGGIDIERGRSVGDLSSVNGGITLKDDVHAGNVSTVNGSVTVHDHVSVDSIKTTNGAIRADRDFSSNGDLKTVNGSVKLRQGGYVDGSIATVNGAIDLNHVRVTHDLETLNGDVSVRNGSEIDGDVTFKHVHHRYSRDSRPTLTVDSDSIIKGTIYIYQPVDVHIAAGAHVGNLVKRYDDVE
ncbi:MAG TPA: hypothetical protein VJ998_00925 [Pseudomonadales bacterium]|nr:hypothetical protein [Pseudomonadales bacterium]